MKIKPQYFVLFLIFFIGGIFGVLFLNNTTMQDLFSRSVDIETVSEEVGADPRPAVESLDGQSINDARDFASEIQALERELLETQNNPEKAFELRRRIQLLKDEQAATTSDKKNV